MNTPTLAAAGLAAALLLVPAARAVPLAPGDFVSPLPGTTVALEPQLAGTVVEDVTRVLDGSFTGTGESFQLEVQDRVVLAVDGSYDFYQRITLLDKPDVYPLTVTRRGFEGFDVNAGWRIDGLAGEAPGSASRTADGGAVVFAWDFGAVPEGSRTRFFFTDTNATAYGAGLATLDLSPSFEVNGRVSFETFAPAIPEPSAAWLLAAGLALLARVRSTRS